MPLPPKGFIDRAEGWGIRAGSVEYGIQDTGEWPIIPKHRREPEIHLDGYFTDDFIKEEPVFENRDL